ncbi:hypothetical protein KSD_71120 [Ktedonobacter sp. SOSP1-85]|nr:hypothetical protein KSD_71120 [Ktedonobacter sp. SOSP1-85]
MQSQTYLWEFTPGYEATSDPTNPWQCQDCFTAYLSQTKAGPLRIFFRTWENPIIGSTANGGSA